MQSKATNTPTPQGSKEKEQIRMMRILAEQREEYIKGILFNLIQSCGRDLFWDNKNEDAKDIHIKLVDKAVEMADHLMRVMYKIPKEDNNEE